MIIMKKYQYYGLQLMYSMLTKKRGKQWGKQPKVLPASQKEVYM
jgi:hypothetical protein